MSVNLYTNEAAANSNYIIPGPPLYGKGTGSPAPPPPPAPSVGHPIWHDVLTSLTVASQTSAAPTAPPPAQTSQVGTVGQFGQCGGIGYSGPTACVSPFSCKAQNGTFAHPSPATIAIS